MRIAIDAMGGDRAPDEIVKGAIQAARDFDLHVLLVGDEAAIRKCLPEGGEVLPPRVEIVHTTQVVAMDEGPMQAVKRKKDSSLGVATRLHAEGRADAVLSAGNTGAAAAYALFTLKRIPGVDRPGIATVFPTQRNPLVLMDAGANADCRPRHLAEFAIMGAAYARTVTGIIPGTKGSLAAGEVPQVGLLSIGEEESKGNELTKAAYKLLRQNAPEGGYEFYGNVEGRDISSGTVNVVVCDGFVGNVVLKVAEGLAKMFAATLREMMTRDLRSKLGAMLLMPSVKKVRRVLDYSQYGGAVLLGVNGVCIICHGSSDHRAIYSALRITKQTVAANIVQSIRQAIEKTPPSEAPDLDTGAEKGASATPASAHSPTSVQAASAKLNGGTPAKPEVNVSAQL